MAQFQPPVTFTAGQVLTASALNAHVSSAILLPGAVTDQTDLAANTVAVGDSLIIHDLSALALKEATIGDLLNSGLAITTGSITGNAGANIVVTPASTYAFSVAGNLSSTGNLAVTGTSTLTGDVTASGLLTVVGNASFNSVEALKLPSGTTLQRPASPVAGQMRYNSTLSAAEVYNGTSWDAVPVGGTTLTLAGTVNITGAIQYNGTPVYGLSAVTEETISFSGSVFGTMFTSSVFTKPSDEIWHFEIEGTVAKASTTGNLTLSFVNTSGTAYTTWQWVFQSVNNDHSFKTSWVVNAGTALTAETIRITNSATSWVAQSGVNKLRIYKYRTA